MRCYCSANMSFIFTDASSTEIYTLSLHDALPIWKSTTNASAAVTLRPFAMGHDSQPVTRGLATWGLGLGLLGGRLDRKSTRLNSSHVRISYAVFCLKKKSSG